MSVLLHQFRAEQRLYWRSRELAFFTFIFPLLLLPGLGCLVLEILLVNTRFRTIP